MWPVCLGQPNLGLEPKWGDVKLGRLSGPIAAYLFWLPRWLENPSSKSSRLIPILWDLEA